MESELTGGRYVLAVQNLKASADYYIGELGFSSRWAGDGWHFVSRGNITLMLGECADEIPARDIGDHSYFGYFEVTGIDRLYWEYRSRNVEIIRELGDMPWGQREFGIRTPDGHRIAFGEAI